MGSGDAEGIQAIFKWIAIGISTALFLYVVYFTFEQLNRSTNNASAPATQESWSAINILLSNPILDAVGLIVIAYGIKKYLERRSDYKV